MGELRLRVVISIVCLLGGFSAHSLPLTYNFVGSGSVCTYVDNAACETSYAGTFTGTITMEVLASGPSGADSFTNGVSLAYDYNGWVEADFLIQWENNSFNPGPVPSQIASDHYVQLANDYFGVDHVSNRENYVGFDGTTHFNSNAILTRQTNDLSWLSDLSFPSGLGLAPVTGAVNQLSFAYQSNNTETGLLSGFGGTIHLASLTMLPVSVPEPSVLTLLGLSLAAVGLLKSLRSRRRLSHASFSR